MCNFFSCLLKKTGEVLSLPYTDSHDELIRVYQLDDSIIGVRNWMRIEIRPPLDDVFNTHLYEWKIHIDEYIKEEWYLRNKIKYDKDLRSALRSAWKTAIIVDRTEKTIKNRRVFIGGNGIVEYVGNNGIVEYVGGNGIVKSVGGNGIVKHVGENGIVEYVGNNGIVEYVSNNGIVEYVGGNGIVKSVGGNGIVKHVGENGIVKSVGENGIVETVGNNGIVRLYNDTPFTLYGKGIVFKGNKIVARKGAYELQEMNE